MKLVQFWRNGRPALGLQTERGVVDAAAEAPAWASRSQKIWPPPLPSPLASWSGC